MVFDGTILLVFWPGKNHYSIRSLPSMTVGSFDQLYCYHITHIHHDYLHLHITLYSSCTSTAYCVHTQVVEEKMLGVWNTGWWSSCQWDSLLDCTRYLPCTSVALVVVVFTVDMYTTHNKYYWQQILGEAKVNTFLMKNTLKLNNLGEDTILYIVPSLHLLT